MKAGQASGLFELAVDPLPPALRAVHVGASAVYMAAASGERDPGGPLGAFEVSLPPTQFFGLLTSFFAFFFCTKH